MDWTDEEIRFSVTGRLETLDEGISESRAINLLKQMRKDFSERISALQGEIKEYQELLAKITPKR